METPQKNCIKSLEVHIDGFHSKICKSVMILMISILTSLLILMVSILKSVLILMVSILKSVMILMVSILKSVMILMVSILKSVMILMVSILKSIMIGILNQSVFYAYFLWLKPSIRREIVHDNFVKMSK